MRGKSGSNRRCHLVIEDCSNVNFVWNSGFDRLFQSLSTSERLIADIDIILKGVGEFSVNKTISVCEKRKGRRETINNTFNIK